MACWLRSSCTKVSGLQIKWQSPRGFGMLIKSPVVQYLRELKVNLWDYKRPSLNPKP